MGTPLTFTVQAGDADEGDAVELNVIGMPPGAQLSTALPATGNPVSTEFSWTPVAGDFGAHIITFTAYDGCAAGPTQCSFTILVSTGGGACSPTNVALFQSPTPGCGSAIPATVGTPVTFTVLANDADGDSVDVGVIGLPPGAKLSTPLPASGLSVSTNFSWTPVAGDFGPHVITFTASDGCAAGPTQCSFTINVGSGGGGACSPTNVALFQGSTPSCGSAMPATVGTPLTFTVQASDADGDSVDVGVIDLPLGATLSTPLPASGVSVSTNFSWTPAAGDTGSHVITFTAFDGCAAGPTQCSFTLNVSAGGGPCSPTNVALFQSPTPGCGSTRQATVGTPVTFGVLASDADGDAVELGVIGLPAGATLSTPLPASGNPVSTNFSWTPAAGDVGSHVITFTAFDGCAAGPTQCSFTVNVSSGASCTPTNVALFQSPTPSCGSARQATVGTPVTFSVLANDADGDDVELGVIGLPAGATLSTPLPASGLTVSTDFSWTPAAGDVGSHVITFTAFDGCAAGPTQCSFTINVSSGKATCSPTNVALFQSPTPSCGSTRQATVGTPVTFTVLANDADGDSVAVGVIGLPAGATLSTPLPAKGLTVSTDFSWTPTASDVGSHVITFGAFDGCAAGPTQCSFTINVSGGGGACSPTNVALFQSPTPGCGSSIPAAVGTPVTFTVLANDADGDSVDVGVIGLPAGATLSTPLPASGLTVSSDFSWTPAAGDVGAHVITFTAFDGCAAGPTSCSFTVNVSGGGGACSPAHVALFQSPTPSCGSVRQAKVGTPVTFTVLANDADGDSVDVGVIGLPAGATLSTPLPASGLTVSTDFSWTPVAGDVGSHVITFTAFDGCAAGPTQCSFTVNVSGAGGACSPTNVALFQSPTPSCGSTRQATVGTPVTFTVLANDADGDSVDVGVIGLPAGATLSTPLPASGLTVSTNFSWTPAAGDVGSHVITFTAFDGCAAGPTQCSFTINVGGGGPACSPTNVALFQSPTPGCGSTRQVTAGTPITFTVLANDADGDSVEVAVNGLPAGASLSTPLPARGLTVSTNFSWTPTSSDAGTHVITFTAFDGCAAGPTSCSFTVQVIDNQPPNCAGAHVADSEIWPPNGKWVPVHVQGITDPDGDAVTVHVTNITQDEAVDGDGGSCDGRVDENGNASVRAKRNGNGNGRVYHVTYVATDENGASCEGSVSLCVPHDQGRHNDCVDDGQNYPVSSSCIAVYTGGGNDADGNWAGNGSGEDNRSADEKGKKKDEIDLKVTQVSAGVAQVQYTLPAEGQVTLSVYNVAGRRIATISEGRQPAGTGSARWVATNPVPTVYFVQLRSGDKAVAKRIFFSR